MIAPSAGPKQDRGSITILVLLFFLVAMLLVMGTVAASAAFVAQRDLASVCDSAAIAGASQVDLAGFYGSPDTDVLPVDPDAVRAVVADYVATAFPADAHGLTLDAATDGRIVTVTCSRTVRVPFGEAFGYADGLPRTAVSSARVQLRG